jgi:hypothetical protein
LREDSVEAFKTQPYGSATEFLSASALGIHDRGAVCRQREPLLIVFSDDHFKYAF